MPLRKEPHQMSARKKDIRLPGNLCSKSRRRTKLSPIGLGLETELDFLASIQLKRFPGVNSIKACSSFSSLWLKRLTQHNSFLLKAVLFPPASFCNYSLFRQIQSSCYLLSDHFMPSGTQGLYALSHGCLVFGCASALLLSI